jgi:hypothetical protein
VYLTFTLKSKEKSSIQISSNCEDKINIDLKAKFNVCHLRCVNTIQYNTIQYVTVKQSVYTTQFIKSKQLHVSAVGSS